MVDQEVTYVYLDDTRARVRVSGEDRISWLNGVLSNDVGTVAKGGALYACALTEKGKIIADAVVVIENGECGVWVPKTVVDELVTAWDRYIIMEDVELARDDSRSLVFVQGPNAGSDGHKVDDLGIGGRVHDLSKADAEAFIDRVRDGGAMRITAEDAHKLRVENARATFGFDFDQKTYVQEAGLEARAVSFTKGCYHGQEVVCMLENRGKVSKRLVQLEVDGVADVGAEVASDGAVVGKVTSAVTNEGKTTALAMVKAAAAAEGTALKVGDTSATVRAVAR